MKSILITHKTEYHYCTPVTFGPHRALLRPREGHDVHIESLLLEIEPKADVRWLRDIYGNSIALLTFAEPAQKLSLFSEVNVDHYDDNPFDCLIEPNTRSYPFQYAANEQVELIHYRFPSYPHDGPVLQNWLLDLYSPGQLISAFELLNKLKYAHLQILPICPTRGARCPAPLPDTRMEHRMLPRLRGAHDGGRPALGFWGAICHRLHHNGRRPARRHPRLDGPSRTIVIVPKNAALILILTAQDFDRIVRKSFANWLKSRSEPTPLWRRDPELNLFAGICKNPLCGRRSHAVDTVDFIL